MLVRYTSNTRIMYHINNNVEGIKKESDGEMKGMKRGDRECGGKVEGVKLDGVWRLVEWMV